MTKVLIVGGGIAGLSTAWALARRGALVELFEMGPLPNPRSSSHDEHRIIRHSYGEMDGYAHLMPEAFRVWEQLWQATGRVHYEPCGLTYFIRQPEFLAEGGWYSAVCRSLDSMGIGHRDVPLAEVPERFAMMRPEGLLHVLETDGAGMLFPVRILTDLVVLLGRMGVVLHTGAAVTQIDPDHGTLVCRGQTHHGDTVVVAAGAWADRLVPTLRAQAVPSRQAVIYMAPPPDLAEAWANAPAMAHPDPEDGIYVLPPRCGTRLKIGDHRFSRSGDPDGDRIATAQDLAPLWQAMRRVFRDIDSYAVLEPKACFYTVTETEEFLVHPIGPRGWLLSACSGHGFKLGSLMGELVARALTGEMNPADLPDLAAGRIANPQFPSGRA